MIVIEKITKGVPLKVLVVDDDSAYRHLISAVLTANNFSVTLATDGANALEILETFKPDLIVSDLMMPNVNGYELINSVKHNPETKHIPVILLTEKASKEDISYGYEKQKVEYYIAKPFSNHQLLAGIKLVLGV